MITDEQVKLLRRLHTMGKGKEATIIMSGMIAQIGRKYFKSNNVSSKQKIDHNKQTQQNSFEADWSVMKEFSRNNHELRAKTIFQYFQRRYPGQYREVQYNVLKKIDRFFS